MTMEMGGGLSDEEMEDMMDGIVEIDDIDVPDSDAAVLDPRAIFNEQSGWDKASICYYIEEHIHGNGLKSIVWKSQIDNKRKGDFGRLSDRQTYFVLLIAALFFKIKKGDKESVCSMIAEINRKAEEERCKELELYNKAVSQVLEDEVKDEEFSSRLYQLIQSKFKSLMKENDEVELPRFDEPKDVRRLFTEGDNSFIKQLPQPEVTVSNQDDLQFAYISVLKSVRHVLALGINCEYRRVGHEEDWTDADPRVMHCYEDVKRRLGEGKLEVGDRVIFLKLWSDGFEVHKIAGNNEYNSVNIFIVRIGNYALPYAFGFKKHIDVERVMVQLVKEVNALMDPREFYFGEEKCVKRCVFYLYCVICDYPERCAVTSTTNNGTYSKRFGFSQRKTSKTPSCYRCQKKRRNLFTENSMDDKDIGTCRQCTDWWYNIYKGNKYPLSIGFENKDKLEKDPPSVQLTFKMQLDGLKEAYEWNKAHGKEKQACDVLKIYLRVLCLRYNDEIYKKIRSNATWDEVLAEAHALFNYVTLGIELELFPSAPMHMFFLGVTESNLDVAKYMKCNNRDWWRELRTEMFDRQRVLSETVNIDWIATMPFTGSKDNNLGTSNWLSKSASSFTRISLYQFSLLDKNSLLKIPRTSSDAVKAFSRMTVIWFCLMCHCFAKDILARRIDHLVRLFLSACQDYGDVVGEDFMDGKCNYFSLLNLVRIFNDYGSVSTLWEGNDEAEIQPIKQEIAVMRHDTSHLKTLTQKVLTTSVLKHLSMNENNPFKSQSPFINLDGFKVYFPDSTGSTALEVFNAAPYISGVVSKEDNMYFCFKPHRNGYIKLYPLEFDDRKGVYVMNLWYSSVTLGNEIGEDAIDRKTLKEFCFDSFLMLKIKEKATGKAQCKSMRTVICHSWRVRTCDGLVVPLPSKEYL